MPGVSTYRTVQDSEATSVPIDFFSYRNASERAVLIDQLIDIFDLENAPISKPRLLKILGTLFDANENEHIPDEDRCTFLDIESFITSKEHRDRILSYCPDRKGQWAHMPKISEFEPILERMAPFTERGTLRTLFEAKRPRLNIWDVMQDKQILLVNIKDTPSDLFIGSLICSKFQQATFGRRYIDEAKRIPYYLYIDECHTILKYAAAQFEAILTRARKYKLCLALANQIPDDLPEGIQRKLGTIHTKVLYNLDEKNAALFKPALQAAAAINKNNQYVEDERERILRKLQSVQHEINFLKERAKKGDVDEHTTPQKVNRLLYDREQLTQRLNELPPSFSPATLQKLGSFNAIAVLGSRIQKISTPKPLGASSASYAKYIRKRTVENYACEPPPMPHDVSSSSSHDDIPASAEPKVPPYKGKEGHPRTPR